jgi:hypothetical protein
VHISAHNLGILTVFVFFFSSPPPPTGEFLDSISDYVTTYYFYILSISLFNKHPIIRCYIIYATESVVKKTHQETSIERRKVKYSKPKERGAYKTNRKNIAS